MRIAYAVHGSGRPPLVFVHGWACDRSYWRHQLREFSRTHAVIAVDLGGHGESGADRRGWTLAALASDVVAVLEREDARDVILVGHSLGGPVALLAAGRVPARVGGVVLVESAHNAEAAHRAGTLQFVAALERDFTGTLLSGVPGLFPPDADPALTQWVARDMAAAPPGLAIALQRSYADFQWGRALAAVRVPVRAINASATNVPGNRRFARDFDVVTMEDVGHFPMLERPRAFNAVLAGVLEELRAKTTVPR